MTDHDAEVGAGSRCPRCGAPTVPGSCLGEPSRFLLCSSIGCPWFFTTDDNKEHFR